ncbi:MAG: DUF2272 domain-containing protein [Rhizobiales bacterium]|nr:DUF2272 domain-containing protein [Hyphomicrobiales bacterium]
MRFLVCAMVAAIAFAAPPAHAQSDRAAAAFWKAVQARCDATAAKPPSALGRRIAQTAIAEFTRFNGHRIDSDGRLFRFGLTEAEHNQEDGGGGGEARLGRLGWWQVMKYWRALYGDEFGDKLEVRGYRDASTATDPAQSAELIDNDVGVLLRAADAATDAATREILREAAMRAAVIDTPWSAAFISYVIKQAGVKPEAFQFSNAHRAYIYEAFAASAAEQNKEDAKQGYRACPMITRARPGDIVCQQRERTLAEASEAAVRERIRTELAGPPEARTVRRTHCEVVASIDTRAHKLYSIGGNVEQAITARKLNLRRDLKFSPMQKGSCTAQGQWTMPQADAEAAPAGNRGERCSLNDRKWFVLLQLR